MIEIVPLEPSPADSLSFSAPFVQLAPFTEPVGKDETSRIVMSLPRQTSREALLVWVVVLSLLMALGITIPHLTDPYRVEKDMQNFYWMASYQDPDLFPKDYLLGHTLLKLNVLGQPLVLYPASLAYGLLFYLSALGIDQIWLSKLLVFLLMPLSIMYLFKIGEEVAGRLQAICLCLLFAFFVLASPRSISIATGVQRAFALPLLIAFSYYILQRRYVASGVLVLASALIYLPTFPLLALTYALLLLQVRQPFKIAVDVQARTLVPLLAAVLVGLSVVALAWAVESARVSPSIVGGKTFDSGQSEIWRHDASHGQGVYPLFSGSFLVGRAGIFDMGAEVINLLTLLLLGGIVYAIVGRRSLQRMPAVLWHLLAASAILYGLSLFILLHFSSTVLYLPSRYTRATLFLATVCFVGLNWGEFLGHAAQRFHRAGRTLVFFLLSLSLLLTTAYVILPEPLPRLSLLLVLGLPLTAVLAVLSASSVYWLLQRWKAQSTGGSTPWQWIARTGIILLLSATSLALGSVYIGTLGVASPGTTTNPSEAEREVYEFVRTLPKDAMLMGDPEIMSGIPLFSERSVLFRALQPRSDAPILEFFDAYYAETPQTMLGFCQKYGVDYLVVNQQHFADDYLETGEYFYDPYNGVIAKTVSERTAFVLSRVASENRLFQSGALFVVPCTSDVFSSQER